MLLLLQSMCQTCSDSHMQLGKDKKAVLTCRRCDRQTLHPQSSIELEVRGEEEALVCRIHNRLKHSTQLFICFPQTLLSHMLKTRERP